MPLAVLPNTLEGTAVKNLKPAGMVPQLIAAGVALASLATIAQAASDHPATPTPSAVLAQAGSSSSSPGMASPRKADNPDQKFAEKAAASDLAEIESGKLAQKMATSPSVKQFADHMVADHTKASEKLKSITGSKGISLPAKPDRSHAKKLESLQKLQGDKFDREYMKMMVADHKDAVSLFEKESKQGKDAELKSHAATLLPDLQEHLMMAQSTEAGLKKKSASAK